MALDFHFINVGKGNCTIIDFPNNYLTVVDIDDSRCLSEQEKQTMLLEKSISVTNPVNYISDNFNGSTIFRFILTHPDMDHMSGLKSLLRKKILNFWDTSHNKEISSDNWSNSPYSKEDWDAYQAIRQGNESPKILQLYRNEKSDCCWVQNGIKIISPTKEIVKEANEKKDYDHLSYVLMIEHANRKILLGGDATKKAWEDIIRYYENENKGYLKSDVFLAPNHGSPNHISKEILDAINPGLTIVSVAEGVDYDRELYSKYGAVLSTKYYGNIRVRVEDAGTIYVRTQSQTYSDQWYQLKKQ